MKVQKFRDFQVGDDWVEWLNLCIELLGLQKECAYLKKSILFVSMYVYTGNLMFSISSRYIYISYIILILVFVRLIQNTSHLYDIPSLKLTNCT